MVRHRLNISRMIYRLEFGHEQATDKVNPNTGKPIKEFVPEFERWAGKWSLRQSDILTLKGAGITNAMVFVIRHDESITSDYILRLDNKTFSIDNVSYDEGRTVDAYDLITCHQLVNKHG